MTNFNFGLQIPEVPFVTDILTIVDDTLGGDCVPPVCYVQGSSILTSKGDVAVEDLIVGDVVVTVSGDRRPIRWLGHRTIDCRKLVNPADVLPVRIAAHAFGHNRPARDLNLSPGHSICVDVLGEVLIPAGLLVNGTTIQQIKVDTVTYWHVELDSHDVILAENLPAETYLDRGNRGFFQEADVVDLAAGPDAGLRQGTHAEFCRPSHESGPIVEAVRAQLCRRARAQGWCVETPAPFSNVRLEVDGRIVTPDVRSDAAYFLLPAEAQDVWLISPTGVPRHFGDSSDGRELGLRLSAVTLDDGLGQSRSVDLDDPLLCEGFFELEGESGRHWRWTADKAHLPSVLFADLDGPVVLRLDLAGPSVARWMPKDIVEATIASEALAA